MKFILKGIKWAIGATKRTKTMRRRIGLLDFGKAKISTCCKARQRNYDEIRAVAYILERFGSPYACPSDFLDKLQPTIRKVVTILENMINPPSDEWVFLEIWENSPQIIDEIKRQIAELKEYLK